nr:expressed protein [Hymenolepis microstoma]CUU99101.1 hypothetical transcript [Hymenolepis microstoma]
MGNIRSVMQDWASTHIKICKIISALTLVMSLILIIAGAVMAAQNNSGWDNRHESFDDFTEKQSRFAGGIAMILIGIFLFVCSIISFCFSFQLKYFERIVQPDSNQENHQTYSQSNPQQMPSIPSHAQAPYPTNGNYQEPPPMYYPPTAPTSNFPPPYKDKYVAGIVLIIFGILLFTSSIVLFCFSFQLKFIQKDLDPDNQPQRQFGSYTPQQQPPYSTNSGPTMPAMPANLSPYPE